MRRIIALFVGIVLGGTVMYLSFQYHLVRSEKGFALIKKRSTSLQDVYVDIRHWGFPEWKAHPALAEAVFASGRSDLVGHVHREGVFKEFFSRFWKGGEHKIPER
jgi:hypothetical protein